MKRGKKDKESNAKQKDQDDDAVRAMAATRTRRPVRCYNCGKMGHIQWNCPLDEKPQYRRKDSRYKANTALYKSKGSHGSDSECDALMVSHAFKVSNCSMGSWIVDSGATSHMCGSKTSFVELRNLNQPMEVTLGDGNVAGQGVVSLKMKLSDGSVRRCKLLDVLYVPGLAYNLLSVSKAAESGNVTNFDANGCQILNKNQRVVAKAVKCGSLYYLDCEESTHGGQCRTTGIGGDGMAPAVWSSGGAKPTKASSR